MTLKRLLIGLALAAFAVGPTQAEPREQPLSFAAGATAVTARGMIKGSEDRRYTLRVGEGQVLHVLFSPSNRACYFNAFAPVSGDNAVHIGSTSGHEFGASPAQPGLWYFQVYLMRGAARRHEMCHFNLNIELTGKPGGASVGQSDQIIRDQCLAQAAPMYGVQKHAIKLGLIEMGRDGVTIDGTVDKGRQGIKRLRCRFTVERLFIDVMAMTPDGE